MTKNMICCCLTASNIINTDCIVNKTDITIKPNNSVQLVTGSLTGDINIKNNPDIPISAAIIDLFKSLSIINYLRVHTLQPKVVAMLL